ncbi:MAG: hypothetical protein MK110_06590 [Fuerstiella sp.]|nr:hypothetical protein [Fuerstiella sp.]
MVSAGYRRVSTDLTECDSDNIMILADHTVQSRHVLSANIIRQVVCYPRADRVVHRLIDAPAIIRIEFYGSTDKPTIAFRISLAYFVGHVKPDI